MSKRHAALARAHYNINAANLGAAYSAGKRALKYRKGISGNRIMADTSMGTNKSSDHSQRDDGNQEDAFMIPGVDGKLQFGFPTKIITILRYFDTYILTSVSGGLSTQVMRMNGPRDPDQSGVGHQPMYWDRYAAIYQSYRVLGSRITAEISGATLQSTQGPWTFGINGSTASTSMGTSVRNRAEQNDSISTVYNGQQGVQRLSFAYSPEIKLGRPAGDDTVGAFVGADPVTQYYAHVWVADMNGATSISSVRIGMEYTIEFHGLVQETES
uniref:Putative capsid protein n=1 Tax=Syrmaticus reevesii CRESS-DNA-virus sp. TaxID=2815059 RepID=A0A8A4XBG0_9VIRU|nr:MAG: putative capsid protein [Syrmaticus reevesii CRESS-DNA-virus sp.]